MKKKEINMLICYLQKMIDMFNRNKYNQKKNLKKKFRKKIHILLICFC